MKFQHLCVIALAAIGAPVFAADDLDNLGTLTQSEFANLSKDLTAAASYKGVSPAEPLGLTGFDIGVELTSTKMDHGDAWKKAGADSANLYMPKVHIHKGLPFNIDIGASMAMVPGSDIKVGGAEVKYALIEGGTATPAVSVRGAYTRLFGVDQLDANTRSLELTVSKGFLNMTPYGGIGKVWGTLTPHAGILTKETPSATKLFAGLNFSLGFGNLAAEVDQTGDSKSVSVKMGFRL